VDPTGAGDCFATAFAVRYAETESFAEAGWFAAAAGALAVEGYGLAGVPTRAAIEQRMKQVAA
jgi:sugar/nucleoside kinase (ribokinase family)